MKMTIEIPEDVLSELMHLTGHKTKREALREAAQRARRHRVWVSAFEGLTPAQLAADAAPKPSDLVDAPDIDWDAVNHAIATDGRRAAFQDKLFQGDVSLNEPQSVYGTNLPKP
jgi:hypothetical protein